MSEPSKPCKLPAGPPEPPEPGSVLFLLMENPENQTFWRLFSWHSRSWDFRTPWTLRTPSRTPSTRVWAMPSEHFINTELNEMHDQGLGNAFLVIIGSLLERILGGSAKWVKLAYFPSEPRERTDPANLSTQKRSFVPFCSTTGIFIYIFNFQLFYLLGLINLLVVWFI